MVISYPSIFSRTVRNVAQRVFGSMITSWTSKKETQALEFCHIQWEKNLLLGMHVQGVNSLQFQKLYTEHVNKSYKLLP